MAALRERPSPATEVLWIAPHLNHYKSRVLSRLAEDDRLRLTVLHGRPLAQGHRADPEPETFESHGVPASKRLFGCDPRVYARCLSLLRRPFDVILCTIELKFLPLIFCLIVLRPFHRYRLVSYNHPPPRAEGPAGAVRRFFHRLLYSAYDDVVFYTEAAYHDALAGGLVKEGKAHWANNTLDTTTMPGVALGRVPTGPGTLLYLGRLVPSKRIDLLLEYFRELKKLLPEARLEIIGNGPEAYRVESAAEEDESIVWHGALIDEAAISQVMRRIHLVFVPGPSGLSIVHSFCYGKPYVTIEARGIIHGPELSYLKDGDNGLLLHFDLAADVSLMRDLLVDRDRYAAASRSALETASELSVDVWCERMSRALLGSAGTSTSNEFLRS